MPEITLFCKPSEGLYKGEVLDIARIYTKMAIEGYDALVEFSKDYKPFADVPDFEGVVGEKGGRDLVCTAFAEQEVVRIGDLHSDFTSSSYLFNPRSTFRGLLLPDLDVILVKGDVMVLRAVGKIQKFYESNGWQTHVHACPIQREKPVESGRVKKVIEPKALLDIARENLGYSLDKVCF